VQAVDGAVDGFPAVGSGEPDGDEPVGEAPAIARGVSWRPERVGVFDGEVGAENWSYCGSARMIR